MTEAIAAAGLRSGGTLSLHHHWRDGDRAMTQALDACAALGLAGLHLAASSLFPCHAALIPRLRDGTVGRITTSYMRGPLADLVASGGFDGPVTLQTHGGRARAIGAGDLRIDLALVGVPRAGPDGALGGADGPWACGPLGYAMTEAAHARHVVALAAERGPLTRTCIPAAHVDAVIDGTPGDPRGIASGTTAARPSPEGARVAALVVEMLAAGGFVRDGMRVQSGAGAVALAVTAGLGRAMAARGVRGAWASGGITAAAVGLHREGLLARLRDVQAFDAAAVASYRDDPAHEALSAAAYADPTRACAAHDLDVAILGAAEVDADFDVNVTTTADGRIIGGSGGHADVAEGAAFTVVATALRAGGAPKLVERVAHRTTAGAHVDAVVTEGGIALPPRHAALAARLRRAGLPVRDIRDLVAAAGPAPAPPPAEGRIVARSEDRHGRAGDAIRARSGP
nr:citrate lyase subunit alpha [Jannaschia sp. Os4]